MLLNQKWLKNFTKDKKMQIAQIQIFRMYFYMVEDPKAMIPSYDELEWFSPQMYLLLLFPLRLIFDMIHSYNHAVDHKCHRNTDTIIPSYYNNNGHSDLKVIKHLEATINLK